jgi:L-lactate dehydrogenase complex protein LldE
MNHAEKPVSDVASADVRGRGTASARVALFVTCLVDLFRPEVGFASIRLLEQAGYSVDVPAQGCCGQPNFNSGDRDGATAMAAGVIERFSGYDYVVAPSGSCAAMLRVHYPSLFAPGSDAHRAAVALAGKTYELTSFLHDVAGGRYSAVDWPGSVTYHDGCSGLRELGIREQPRTLLRSVTGLELRELGEPEACCGFGGLFCVKYPDVSARIADVKTRDVLQTGADTLVSGELGCLLQIEGKLHRDGARVRALHIAEILAGDGPAGRTEAEDEQPPVTNAAEASEGND